jgi:hypothetical protein
LTTSAVRSLALWRGVALTSSALALTLFLRPASHAAPVAHPAASAQRASEPEPAATSELRSLSADDALADSGDEAALSALLNIATSAEPAVERAALHGIAQIGGPRAREFLAQRFSDAKGSELPDLAAALAELGGPEAQQLLENAANSARIPARAAAREALAGLDTPTARDFMLEELSGPEPSHAVSYFADCLDARAVPALERLVRESPADTGRLAVTALFAQGENAEPALFRLLREDDEVSNSVLESPASSTELRAAQRAACIARLRAGAITSGPVFDFLAQDPTAAALDALVRAAHESAGADSAGAALSAISERGDSASLEALSELAGDSDPELASRAACALSSSPDSRSHAFLVRASRNFSNSATAALLRIDAPEARPALARLNASSELGDRLEARRLANRYGLGS